MANEVVVKKEEGITSYLTSPGVKEQITSVLGKDHVDAFVADVVACVQNNEMVGKCTNKSIFSAALLSKSINLPLTPQLGYAYLVPFDNKKQVEGHTEWVKEAVFQVGWKGYVQLALRSNNFRKIIATDVRKGEINGYKPFDDKYEIQPIDFEKRTAKDDKGNYIVPIVGYYAKLEMVNGFVKEMYMSQEDMLAYATKYSKSYRNDLNKHTTYSFWTTKFEEMAKKTMLRQLLGKYGLLTVELEKAYTHDMAIEREDGSLDYVDNKPDDPEPVVNPFKGEVIDAEAVEIPAEIDKEASEVFK
jgi:recombination protein RecT